MSKRDVIVFVAILWFATFALGTLVSWICSVEWQLEEKEDFAAWYVSDQGCPSTWMKAMSALCLLGSAQAQEPKT